MQDISEYGLKPRFSFFFFSCNKVIKIKCNLILLMYKYYIILHNLFNNIVKTRELGQILNVTTLDVEY